MQFQNLTEKIIIIDFGSQVTKLIARRIRDFGVYCEIANTKDLKKPNSLKNRIMIDLLFKNISI